MSLTRVLAFAAAWMAAAPPASVAERADVAMPAAGVQASLEVVVRDAAGQPVRGAQVRIGDRAAVTTDSVGRARVAALAAGTYRVVVTHASLGTRNGSVTLPADAGSLELRAAGAGDGLAASVQRAVGLAGVTATAQRNPALDQLGFYQRMEQNPGQFVTQDAIQSRRAGRLTDVIRRLKGIRILRYSPDMTGMAGSRSGMDLDAHNRIASSRGSTGISTAGPCWMDVYVDGTPVQSADNIDQAQNLDEISTSNVIGMEVYNAAEIPSEYRGSTAACGVILIWTDRGRVRR